MKAELKKTIIAFMFENERDSQLVNNTSNKFRQYMYNEKGEYIIGGKEVSYFIIMAEKLVNL